MVYIEGYFGQQYFSQITGMTLYQMPIKAELSVFDCLQVVSIDGLGLGFPFWHLKPFTYDIHKILGLSGPLPPCYCPIYTTYLYCPNIRSHNADFIFEWPLSQITLSGNECSSSHFCLSPDEVNFRKRRTEKVQPTTPWRPRLNNLLSKYLNPLMEPMFCAAERFGNRLFVCFPVKIDPFAKGIKGILIFHVA